MKTIRNTRRCILPDGKKMKGKHNDGIVNLVQDAIGLERSNQVTVFTFGKLPRDNSAIVHHAGSGCTDEDVHRLRKVLGGAYPVALAGLPSSFTRCYNVFADVICLDLKGVNFEVAELAENPDYIHGNSELPYIVPVEASKYLSHM